MIASARVSPIIPMDISSSSPTITHQSPLQPPCKADERIFLWKGINTPPSSTIDHPIIRFLADLASFNSLQDAGNYGSGLHKFHIFCDIFLIPEQKRLPALYDLLHSFALWATTDPELVDNSIIAGVHFEPVSIATI